MTVLGEIAADAPGVVADALEGPCDLLFHDGAHSREAYIEDFNAFAPHLAQGAIVIFDTSTCTTIDFIPTPRLTSAGQR